MKKAVLLLTLLTFSIHVLADDYGDEDEISMSDSFYMALIGGGIFLVGSLIAQAKPIKGLGQVIAGIGGFVGVLGLFGIAMVILSAALNLAFKIAIVAGVIIVAYYVIRWLYHWITGENKKS